ncbi:MAG TPA: hypothetical protein PKH94_04080 [Bacteroidales bacterium]|nr:hypothetical protein [Bacteroidales bacterium]HNS46395.1 hypothetical protein [Bacteroidales bacterium]
MIKILFVCNHNTCRSPLAAGILQKKFQERNIHAFIDSAGLEPHLIGEPVDPVTLDLAKQHGIDLSQHLVRLFGPSDFDDFDRIYVMDYNGYRDVMLHARNEQDKKKVDYVMNVLMPGTKQPIPHIADVEAKYVKEAFSLFEKVSGQILASHQSEK